jgi:hypothetical protein
LSNVKPFWNPAYKAAKVSLIQTALLVRVSLTGNSVGYGGYYGRRPWGYHPGYVGSGIGPGIEIDDGPVAAQMPEMGRPDFGDMDMDMGMGMDMDGFDF